MSRLPPGEDLALRAAIAFVWGATGLLVLHPGYRQVGGGYLDALGLPRALMVATCAAEVLLAGVVLARPFGRRLALLQAGAMLAFTAILAVHEPMLLVDPFGRLSKNLPMLACIAAVALGREEGFSPRLAAILRVGVALPWLTEGLLPKILFPQPVELAVVAASPLSFGPPRAFLAGLGALQVLSFFGALLLRGAWLRACLAVQAAALVALPLLVSMALPELWWHPFGPLTKNVPILVGTLVVLRRVGR
ncbi:DoxX-like family protein [Myxococcota bacterium]|nr:DoxX-like family protein [Myxococcota bacterium]